MSKIQSINKKLHFGILYRRSVAGGLLPDTQSVLREISGILPFAARRILVIE